MFPCKSILIQKNNYMKQRIAIILTSLSLVFTNCTKLDEKLQGQVNLTGSGAASANVDALLTGAYNSARSMFQDQGNLLALGEMSTDALIGPTRGGDWDDDGAWRVLHTHTFTGNNTHVVDVFNGLGGINFAATDILRFSPTPVQAAQARFLRAFAQ